MVALLMALGLLPTLPVPGQSETLVDCARASVVLRTGASSIEAKAAQMLRDEVNRRGGRWRIVTKAPAAGNVVYLGVGAGVRSATRSMKPPAEGYRLSIQQKSGRTVVTATGNDARGCMFAAGHIIRLLRWGDGRLRLPALSVETAPAKPMRGHQLGWRPTANSYDRWGLKEYEQYIRDLIVWGTNAIELIPFDSAYDREKNLRFTCALADLIASYGLEVWLWYPADDTVPEGVRGDGLVPGQLACPSQSDGRRFLLDRRRELFSRIRHLDGVLIPGGDPSGCQCEKCTPWVKTFLALAEEIAGIVHRYHPKAGVWISNQGFRDTDNDTFYAYLRTRQPDWLAGLVHAPWAEETVASMRGRTPSRYPIRQYPDICHCVRCQYPVPDWDQAFAATLGREPVIYRPSDHAHIARLFQPLTVGAVTYSDGVTDDLNKVIWSAILWDPGRSDKAVVEEYTRCFFGERAAQDAVRGIYLLEANWRRPVLGSPTIPKAFALWQRLEKAYPEMARNNWRFQMALLRAYYDRYVQIKLTEETQAESQLVAYLRNHPESAQDALLQALRTLDEGARRTSAPDLRQRLLQLGQQLFDSIGLQLSVPRWGASGSERGAVLDFLDVPLCNQEWMRTLLERAREEGTPQAAEDTIRTIVHWEDPGPGGFYDDLGNPQRQPHLVRLKTWRQDPGYVESTRTDFAIPQKGYRQSWVHYAESLYGAPIILRYTGLDRQAQYYVRATYSGRYKPTMELWADGRYRVHGPEPTTIPPTIKEWPVPKEATADGTLELRWTRLTGRGAQVSEVWLIRQSAVGHMGTAQ